jgi:NIPSNAP
MIYEMRTYTIKPGSAAEFEQRWAPLIAARQQLSPLAGIWRTEIGPLNQMIHVWPYASVDERTRIRAEAVARGGWPPPTSDLIDAMESEILLPAPFMRPTQPAAMGGIYDDGGLPMGTTRSRSRSPSAARSRLHYRCIPASGWVKA